MSVTIRPAHQGDVSSIVPWTEGTFSWGDYVPERLPRWISSDDSEVLVTVDTDDKPTALVHIQMLSPTEAWIEGARVHPDHRREGLGSELNHAGLEWARRAGGRVIRLAVEDDNEAARSQVLKLGYREVSRWVWAEIEIDPTYRAPEQHRLRPAPGSDAEAAWLFWAASDLAREGRELIPIGWQWRTARPADMTAAAADSEVLQSPAGWAAVSQPDPDYMRTVWIATTPEGLLPLLDGLTDLAAERRVEELDVKLPNLGWTAEALTRTGGSTGEINIYAKAV